MRFFAGIGSRQTPVDVLASMTALTQRLTGDGWCLRSGGARGADSAFAAGAPIQRRRIYLPWSGYNTLSGPDCHHLVAGELTRFLPIAEQFHPAWEKCSAAVRALHARNVAIVLSLSAADPVRFIICWTPGARVIGGTGLGLRLAQHHDIPIVNLAHASVDTVERFISVQ